MKNRATIAGTFTEMFGGNDVWKIAVCSLLIALLGSSCTVRDESDQYVVNFRASGAFGEQREERPTGPTELTLRIKRVQVAGQALKGTVHILNDSQTPVVLRNPHKGCELQVQDDKSFPIIFSAHVSRGLVNDKSEVVDQVLEPGSELLIQLTVATVLLNPSEYYAGSRHEGQPKVAASFGPVPAGTFKVSAVCEIEARKNSDESFSIETFKTSAVSVVVEK